MLVAFISWKCLFLMIDIAYYFEFLFLAWRLKWKLTMLYTCIAKFVYVMYNLSFYIGCIQKWKITKSSAYSIVFSAYDIARRVDISYFHNLKWIIDCDRWRQVWVDLHHFAFIFRKKNLYCHLERFLIHILYFDIPWILKKICKIALVKRK